LHVAIVKEEIILQLKTKEIIQRNLNSKNIVSGVKSIRYTKKLNKRAVAQLARALDSKSSGWGFESLLP
jgi:hypothetical protein